VNAGEAPVSTAHHRSIGEVLALLKDEFPDITISKIRFLESQGLLDPERTPSGYRRFYDKDVERLRWILRQQREHFLPLKVIKGRLAEGLDHDAGLDARPEAPTSAEPPEASDAPAPEAPAPDASATAKRPSRKAEPAGRRVLPEPTLFSHRSSEPTLFAHRSGEPEPLSTPGPSRPPVDSSVSLTVEELAAASGLPRADIADLERFGLLEHRTIGATDVYDDDALLVARLAAAFRDHGVEARHLRMYKVAVDRESGFIEQMVLPFARQRSPEARARVSETIDDLSRLGEGLHAALLKRALKHLS
jgi:DNA-binding transcriptional MerR regulator